MLIVQTNKNKGHPFRCATSTSTYSKTNLWRHCHGFHNKLT